jgi:hypothetical protein
MSMAVDVIKKTYHLDWIEFTVKLGKENTHMPPSLDLLFKERFLIGKVFLLAEEMSHTAISNFNWTDQGALYVANPLEIKSLLFQGLLETFCLPCLSCHLLQPAVEIGTGVIGWDNCIFLFSLPTPI